MNIKKLIFLTVISASVLTSCTDSSSSNQKSGADSTATAAAATNEPLLGAGSSFVYPLFSKMFDVYHQAKNIQVNYQSIGSGGGIKQLQNKTINFGASDAPMNDDQLSKSPGAILHIPDCLGAVVITYNLPGDPTLKMTPDVLADIFLGKLTKWNDSRIQSLNPDVKLPNLAISVAHRSDGSGTTYIFSDYLSKVSPDWQSKVGKGTALSWPTGVGAKGNEGVSGIIKQTPGCIGYVELAYSIQNKMPSAELKNKSGNFMAPTLASTNAAAKIDNIPADMRVSITDTDAPDGYPICSFSYILIYKDLAINTKSQAQAQQVLNLIAWIIQDGQQYSESLLYAKLPDSVVKMELGLLKTVTYNNTPLTLN